MNIVLILLKPFCILFKKSISFRNILNPISPGEECPQLFTGLGLRVGPEPAHPFPLDMIQTSLDNHAWPDQSHGSHNGTFAIAGYESRIQPLAFEINKPRVCLLERLLFNVNVSDDLLIYAIHNIQQAAFFVKVGRIVKYILYLGIIDLFLGFLFKPVVLNAIECKSAVARKLAKPSDGITLGDPQIEPVLAAVDTVITGFPDKCALAV
jgi:hypothetical protein